MDPTALNDPTSYVCYRVATGDSLQPSSISPQRGSRAPAPFAAALFGAVLLSIAGVLAFCFVH